MANFEKQESDLKEKVVFINRVAKVVKGGRRFSFSALVVVGDENGHVGMGLGKAAEVPEAIRKGKEDAMKKLVTVARDENGSITHDFVGKFGSAQMLLKKAPEGTGVIAGGPARAVIELAGIKNIRTKCMGSRNKQNVVLATIAGLSQLKTPEEVAKYALDAGVDIFLMPDDTYKMYDYIVNSVKNGEISQKRIDQSVERILNEKYDIGLINIENK